MFKDMEWLIFGAVWKFSVLWDFFEIFFKFFFAGPPARIIITPVEDLLRVQIMIWRNAM